MYSACILTAEQKREEEEKTCWWSGEGQKKRKQTGRRLDTLKHVQSKKAGVRYDTRAGLCEMLTIRWCTSTYCLWWVAGGSVLATSNLCSFFSVRAQPSSKHFACYPFDSERIFGEGYESVGLLRAIGCRFNVSFSFPFVSSTSALFRLIGRLVCSFCVGGRPTDSCLTCTTDLSSTRSLFDTVWPFYLPPFLYFIRG